MSVKKSGNSELGRHLKLLRIKCNLTMMQTAEATGITQGYISQIENGIYTPSAKTLSKLARAYKVAELSLLRKAGIVQHSGARHPGEAGESRFSEDFFTNGEHAGLGDAVELAALLKRGLQDLEQLTSVIRQQGIAAGLPASLADMKLDAGGSTHFDLPVFDAQWQPVINALGVPGVFSLPQVLCNADKDAFILIAGDNAMAPAVSCGDWVLVSPGASLDNGNLVAINDRNTIHIRAYSVAGDTQIFSASNPEFAGRLLVRKEGDSQVELVGRVLRVVNHEF